MANREILEMVARSEPEIENTEVMRELHPELNWYWDKVDHLIECYNASEDMIARRMFDYE